MTHFIMPDSSGVDFFILVIFRKIYAGELKIDRETKPQQASQRSSQMPARLSPTAAYDP